MKMRMDKVQHTCNDQDSDISFKNDTDDEIDTTAIEEEEWMEYMKRGTHDAIDEMEDAKIRCWIKTHKRMNWRLALRIASLPSERWIVKVQYTRPTEQLVDEEEDGKTTSTNSSSTKRLRLRTLLKVTTNTTNHSSKQEKTVKDRLC